MRQFRKGQEMRQGSGGGEETRVGGAAMNGNPSGARRRLLLAAVLLVWVAACASVVRKADVPPAPAGAGLIDEARSVIQRVYVDQAAAEQRRLTEGAIRGMVEALGDTGHSRFLTPEMRREQRQLQRGAIEGIGATLKLTEDRVVVVAPLDDSPAQQAGIRAGDVILKVDGRPVSGLSLPEVVKQIAGPANTCVDLTVGTAAGDTVRELKVTRRRVRLQNVTWAWLPGTRVAHLRVAAFSRGVTRDLRIALRQIQQGDASGVVLDLRGNPGGLLDEGVGTASQFLTEGTVLQERDSKGATKSIPVDSGGVAPDIRLVVLVDAETASAAEIVAAALQDAGRASILGQRTFGTGTILQSFPLSDGSALLLGVGEWLTPAGRPIWHHGITPDVAVALDPKVQPLIPAEERQMTPEALHANPDRVLLRALELLHAPPATIEATANGGHAG